jgi:hypothetical protein
MSDHPVEESPVIESSPSLGEPHHPPTSVFVAMFFAGFALLAPCVIAREVYAEKNPVAASLALLGEHLGSAIIVAALIGYTYERLVHGHVMDSFAAQLRAQSNELTESIQSQQSALDRIATGVRATSASSVFGLLRDIAERQDGIPTLYIPVRSKTNEFVLSTHKDFFKALISSPTSRSETVESIRAWIDQESSPSLRFLGSDFVGMLRLHELVDELREVITARRAEWRKLPEIEKGCVLNYVWASSRCEVPRYQELRQLLLDFDEDFVREWILFVPLQMPDHEFVEIIDVLLMRKGGSLSCEMIAHAFRALGALYRAGHEVVDVVQRHGSLVEKCKLTELLRDEMTTLPLGQAKTGGFRWKRN